MKTLKIWVAALLATPFALHAQQDETGPAIPATGPAASTANQAAHAWYRGGNFQGGAAGSKNVFGTLWNSPIYTKTDNVLRSKLNGTLGPLQYFIDGYGLVAGVNTSGYMLLGPNQGNFYNNRGAFSQLHINGTNPLTLQPQDAGFRPWMKAGISFTDNDDFAYIGSRAVAGDITEFTVAWGNNDGENFPGPDDMVFRFTTFGSGNTTINNDRTSPNDIDGRHIARFTPMGDFGLGNTFGLATQGYIRPQSQFHMSKQGTASIFGQITNQATGETANDGLRWGVLDNLHGVVMYQENQPLRFLTDWDNTPGNTINGERMRISTVSAPGVPAPAAPFSINTTRIGISHVGTSPVTEPRALLHLGENTVAGTATAADGWRNWMDMGIFMNKQTDNIYVGLKRESPAGGNFSRYDAVINWGDNPVGAGTFIGPDNLRFIFTSGSFAPGVDTIASSYNGLEVGRFYPGYDSTFTNGYEGYGRFGIGDFTSAGVNQQPTHKLDVIGNGRFRYLPDSLYLRTPDVQKVVFVDSLGVLRWQNAFLGNYCGASPNPMQSDYEFDMADNDIYFRRGGSFNIGDVFCGLNPPSRVYVRNSFSNGPLQYAEGMRVESIPSIGVSDNIGIKAVAQAAPTSNIGVWAEAGGGSLYNYGVYAMAPDLTTNPGPDFAIYANGDVLVTGQAAVSDAMFKMGVDTITNALNIIDQLKPYTYFFDTTGYQNRMYLRGNKQFGFIAQDVEPVLPSLVGRAINPEMKDSSGAITSPAFAFKTLNYNAFIAILTKGMQEQQKEISALEDKVAQGEQIINDLENRLANIEACLANANICTGSNHQAVAPQNSGQPINEISVELADMERVVLDQNVPNPFAEQTVITYYLPETTGKAQMLFYDNNGRLINSVDLKGTGHGKIQIFAGDLSRGTYTYALIVDGNIVDSKRMVKMD